MLDRGFSVVGIDNLLTGDLAFLHDVGGLFAARRLAASCTISICFTPSSYPPGMPGARLSARTRPVTITDGALVTAYQPAPLAVIQQLDPIYVDVTQSSAELLRLRRNLESGRLSADGETSRKVRLLLEDGAPYPQEGVSIDWARTAARTAPGSMPRPCAR